MAIDITFTQPAALWLLFSLPLLLFTHLYFMHHARRKAIRFGNFKTIERVTGKRLLTKNIVLLLVRMLLLTCLILAGAGMTVWVVSTVNTNDVVLLIDASASMASEDMDGSRLDAAKTAALAFIDQIDTAASIGVVQFSGLSEVVLAPTVQTSDASAAVSRVVIKPVGGTDIAGAITTATNLLAASSRGRVIILMTDGVSSLSLYEEQPIEQAVSYAQGHHVLIHTIGIGTQQLGLGYVPGVEAQITTFDEQNLGLIANATGGRYAWARNTAQLASAQDEVIKEAGTAVVPIQASIGLLFCAIILFFLEWGLLNTRYRMLP